MGFTHRTQREVSSWFGFSGDFYTSGPTDTYLAMQYAAANGFYGKTVNAWRTNSLAASEVPDKAWAISAFTDICNLCGDGGLVVAVVADNLQLEGVDYTTLPRQNMDTVFDGLAAASYTPTIIAQIGNEPVIGGSGTHANLTQTYADRAVELAGLIKSDHPTVKLCTPSLGTFQDTTRARSEFATDAHWAKMVEIFTGHGVFNYVGGNIYRWTNSPQLDFTDYGIAYGSDALRSGAASLGCLPIVTEIGRKNTRAADLFQTMRTAGFDLPMLGWKAGSGDDFDLMASGAMPTA